MQGNVFQILLGSVLGDAHIEQRKSGSCRLEIKHALNQYDYLEWKKDQLKSLNPTVAFREDKRQNRQDAVVMRTPVNGIFKIFRDRFYKNTKQTAFPLKYIKHISKLGFLVWYLDDGSLNKGAMNISIKRATKSDRTMLAKVLSDKFGVHFKHNKYGIRLTKGDTKLLLDQLKDIEVPGCMKYKLCVD